MSRVLSTYRNPLAVGLYRTLVLGSSDFRDRGVNNAGGDSDSGGDPVSKEAHFVIEMRRQKSLADRRERY
jgi:hypothetical protein